MNVYYKNKNNSNKGDNCVTVNKETVILHCTEEDSIPKQKLNKRTISDI